MVVPQSPLTAAARAPGSLSEEHGFHLLGVYFLFYFGRVGGALGKFGG